MSGTRPMECAPARAGDEALAIGGEDSTEPAASPPDARAYRCIACRRVFSAGARFCPFDGDALVPAPDYSPSTDPLLGKVLDGRYRVDSVLGEGGMGTVYRVAHVALDRQFALKILRRDVAQDPELCARFLREAKAAAAIGHPNIVGVSDFGELDPAELGAPGVTRVPYFVMDLLRGESLARLLARERRLSVERCARLMLDAASALAAAHDAGVVHRDIKPDNIFLSRVGDREILKLLDFGVAKIAGLGRLTRAGMVFGTPHYMSPEQAAGTPLDERADIYAIGVIMYECLSGRVPFEADTYMGVLTKHMFAEPDPIDSIVPDPACLGAVGHIVMRCLAKRPAARFASMNDVAAALRAALTDPRSTARGAPTGPLESLRLREPTLPPRLETAPSSVTPSSSSLQGGWPLLLAATAFCAVFAGGLLAYRVFGARASRSDPPGMPARIASPADRSALPAPDPPQSFVGAAPPSAPAEAASGAARAEATAVAPGAKPRPKTTASRTSAPAGDVVDPW